MSKRLGNALAYQLPHGHLAFPSARRVAAKVGFDRHRLGIGEVQTQAAATRDLLSALQILGTNEPSLASAEQDAIGADGNGALVSRGEAGNVPARVELERLHERKALRLVVYLHTDGQPRRQRHIDPG